MLGCITIIIDDATACSHIHYRQIDIHVHVYRQCISICRYQGNRGTYILHLPNPQWVNRCTCLSRSLPPCLATPTTPPYPSHQLCTSRLPSTLRALLKGSSPLPNQGVESMQVGGATYESFYSIMYCQCLFLAGCKFANLEIAILSRKSPFNPFFTFLTPYVHVHMF